MYKKPTDTGLLVHYQSHVDVRYKQSLLKAMLNRAFQLALFEMATVPPRT